MMFSALASVLKVPATASAIYAVKEMWSGAVIGVGAAKFLISWLGIAGHFGTVGIGSGGITLGVRSVNATLSTGITEKMGWGYVDRVKKRRMTWGHQARELAAYGALSVSSNAFDFAGGELSDSEAIKSAIESIPKETKEVIGALYQEAHSIGVDDYGAKFLLALVGNYQSTIITGRKVESKELAKDALLMTAAYIVLDRELDAPANEEVLREKERLTQKLDRTPLVYRPFMEPLENRLKVLDNPDRSVLREYKDTKALKSVAGYSAKAIKELTGR
jgi:hypothetical protein